jgi:uncharacterized membrane protein
MKKWLKREGTKWVEENIISEAQLEQLLNRYEQERSTNMLSILASILIGLSILTFIASNWDGINYLARVALILIVMCGFYIAGERVHRKGNARLGNGLLGIGVISFGAGIILLGQMFHFQSYDTKPFIFWSLSSLLVVQLWKSRFLLLLSIAIVTVGQIYSMFQFSSFSIILGLLLLFGIGHFIFHRPDALLSVAFSISYLVSSLLLVIGHELNYQYLYLFYLALYLLSNLVKNKELTRPIQLSMIIGAVLVTIFNIFWLDLFITYEQDPMNGMAVYAVLIAVLLLFFFMMKRKTFDVIDGVMFLPVFYIGTGVDYFYLLILFVYSICLLYIGYREELTEKATFGTILFLIAAFVGYIQLAWDFMPKSLFFLIGGAILFVLSWVLEKRRRSLVKGVRKND